MNYLYGRRTPNDLPEMEEMLSHLRGVIAGEQVGHIFARIDTDNNIGEKLVPLGTVFAAAGATALDAMDKVWGRYSTAICHLGIVSIYEAHDEAARLSNQIISQTFLTL